jgi:CBS domain containing-hemolysin-like protein
MALLLTFAALAIGVSFLCSLLEASLLSVPNSHIEALVARGSESGRRLRDMKERIDRPLAAILTLNTIAHTAGAAGVGAQAAKLYGDVAVGVAGAVMTLLILVLSEIIPKTLGAVHAKSLVGTTATATRAMIVVCLPLIVVLEKINRLLAYEREPDGITRPEILAAARLGRKRGLLGSREYRVVSNLLKLSSISLAHVLTPRTVVFSLPREMSVENAVREHDPIGFSRIPVYEGNPERVTGYVQRIEIHQAFAAGKKDQPLTELARPLTVLPEQASVADALEQMIRENQHIALVVDEYGGTAGIVTLEDLLESLLGVEIVDETDPVRDMQELAKRRRRR